MDTIENKKDLIESVNYFFYGSGDRPMISISKNEALVLVNQYPEAEATLFTNGKAVLIKI